MQRYHSVRSAVLVIVGQCSNNSYKMTVLLFPAIASSVSTSAFGLDDAIAFTDSPYPPPSISTRTLLKHKLSQIQI